MERRALETIRRMLSPDGMHVRKKLLRVTPDFWNALVADLRASGIQVAYPYVIIFGTIVAAEGTKIPEALLAMIRTPGPNPAA